MLAHICDQFRNMKLLSIIVAAIRPLTLTEVNIAMSIERGQTDLADSSLNPDPLVDEDVRKLCGHFVSIQNSKLYLIHQTAKDFLISNDVSKSQTQISGEWKSAFNYADSNLVLANSCVSYLMLAKFQYNTLSDFCHTKTFDLFKEVCDDYLRNNGFLDYAATFWYDHCQEAPLEEDLDLLQRSTRLCNIHSGQYATWICLRGGLRQRVPVRPTDLIIASQCGLRPVVKLILERQCTQVDAADGSGQTALCIAARLGYDSVVELILEMKSVDPNAMDHIGRSSLWYAASYGHDGVVQRLLKEPDINPNTRDRSQEVIPLRVCTVQPVRATPLEVAMYKQHTKVVKLLLNHKVVDPNTSLASGQMLLLHAVVTEEHLENLELLLQRDDIYTNCRDNQGLTPLGRAAKKGCVEVVKMIFDYCIHHHKLEDESIPDQHGWNLGSFISALGDETILESFSKCYPTGLQPTSSKTVGPDDLIELFGVGVRVERDSSGVGVDAENFIKESGSEVQVRSNHPVPPLPSDYYFEVHVVYSSIVLGICTADSDPNVMPGCNPGSCGYHGYDGGLYLGTIHPIRQLPRFGTEDKIGCGFDYRTKQIFYTKNGEFLGSASTSLRGPLFLVIGIQDNDTYVRVNFGNESFVYTPLDAHNKFKVALIKRRLGEDEENYPARGKPLASILLQKINRALK